MPELLGRHKPIVGMVHLAPLPGTPFDEALTNAQILDRARRDLDVLLEAGFDAVSISNESDRPYVTDIPRETIALFTFLVTRLTQDLPVPFGCGMLIDPRASLAVARAVGATFIRLSFGTMVGTFGPVVESPGEVLRYRRQIDAQDVKLFLNLSPHFATSLDTRPIAEIARTAYASSEPDAIQVHGAGAGGLPELDAVRQVKGAVPEVPVIVASGVTPATLPDVLAVGDGVIVGTTLKEDGKIWNPIDPARARAFMRRARELRGN